MKTIPTLLVLQVLIKNEMPKCRVESIKSRWLWNDLWLTPLPLPHSLKCQYSDRIKCTEFCILGSVLLIDDISSLFSFKKTTGHLNYRNLRNSAGWGFRSTNVMSLIFSFIVRHIKILSLCKHLTNANYSNNLS